MWGGACGRAGCCEAGQRRERRRQAPGEQHRGRYWSLWRALRRGGGEEADEGAGPMTTEKDIEIKKCFGKVKACKVESEERRWLKVYSGIDCIVTFSNNKKDNGYDQ